MEICDRQLCTGCTVCKNICPQKAISMLPDDKGFLRPFINDEICINCNICIKSCPQNKEIEYHNIINVFAALNKNDEIRNNSSSGGVFTALAQYIISQDGLVFGAAITDNMHIKHIGVSKKSDLQKLRGSKYVQSDTANTFNEIKTALKQDKYVLFSGTPCQVDALNNYLGQLKNSEYFITIDLLCHGVPSPMIFDKFIKHIEKQHNKKVSNVLFRDKNPGWSFYSMKIIFNDGSTLNSDRSYIDAFLKDLFLRESCYNCKYVGYKRVSDISLGDYWGYMETPPEFIEDDDRGISAVLINTAKGQNIFDSVKDILLIAKRNQLDVARKNMPLVKKIEKPDNFNDFWKDNCENWENLSEKYFPKNDLIYDWISKEKREYYKTSAEKRYEQHIKTVAKKIIKSNKKNYVLYAHDGSANHGCEALVRTTINLLKGKKHEFKLISTKPYEDNYYGIDKLCTVIDKGIYTSSIDISKFNLKFLKAYLQLKVNHNPDYIDSLKVSKLSGVKEMTLQFQSAATRIVTTCVAN